MGLYIDTGANASAEEAEEGTADQAEQKIDAIVSFRLSPTQFDKKQYLTYLKGMYTNGHAKCSTKSI
jgi:hypothetical protein